MNTKCFLSSFFVSLALLCTSLFAKESVDLAKFKPNSQLETITKLTSTIISKQHFRQKPLDNEMSAKIFDQYFKALDPNKLYFSKSDIDKFDKYRLQLDDDALNGNLTFAFDAYKLLVQKMRAHKEFAQDMISRGVDFSVNEDFNFDRSKGPWAENDDELKEIWRKKIKNEILTLKLMDRAETDEKAKKTAPPESTKSAQAKSKQGAKGKPAPAEQPRKDEPKTAQPETKPAWKTKSPEERVLKRIEQYLNLLEANEPIDVLEIYLSSITKAYDPHSEYMSPRTEEDFGIDLKLSLFGIGALLSAEEGYTKIVRLIPGGPAEKDGRLKPDDRIIAVAQDSEDPVDILDMPLNKVVGLIRGKKGTKVHLTVLEGQKGANAIPQSITIVRDEVKLTEREASGKIKVLNEGKIGEELKIGIITLPSFYMDFDASYRGDKNYKSSTRDVKKILDEFNEKGVDGVILDLRSNGGGSLPEAIKLSGLFIKDGPIVQVRANPGDVEVKNDTDKNMYFDGPMIIMLNKLSASATEIFAGAMKDYKRAVLIGDTQTLGKGVVQTVYELKNFLSLFGSKFPAGSVKFTNMQFYRVNGSSTQMKGVEPDIVFPSFTEIMDIGEKDFENALPWDSIKPVTHDTYYDKLPDISAELSRLSTLRRDKNPKFKTLLKDMELYKQLKERKSVSLCEEKRWAEYLGEKKIQAEEKQLLKMDDDDQAPEAKDKTARNDIFLDEGMNIMADYIKMLRDQKTTKVAR